MSPPSNAGAIGAVPWLERIDARLAQAEMVVTLITFVAMLALMVVQVACRYALKIALPWSEELIRYLFVAATFVGAAMVSKQRSHISIDLMDAILAGVKDDATRRRLDHWTWIVSDVASMAASGVFAVLTWRFLVIMRDTEQVSPAMELPVAIVVAAMFAGVALMFVHHAVKLAGNTIGVRRAPAARGAAVALAREEEA